MKKLMINYGGILVFYIIMIFGILYICSPNHNIKSDNFKFNTLTEIAK